MNRHIKETLLRGYFVFSCFLLIACTEAAGRNFYVSPEGNDTNPGTRNRPFKTLKKAQIAVRKFKTKNDQGKGINVIIKEGTYYLPERLRFTEADSGPSDAPVTWSAASGAAPRISGGREVKGFTHVTDPAVLQRLDPTVRGKVLQADLKKCGIHNLGKAAAPDERIELFFRDRPMQIARWPNKGFATIKDAAGETSFTVHGRKGTREGKLVYSGERPSRWTGEDEIYLHGYWFWDWSDSYEPVASIDPERKIIETAPPYHNYGFRRGQRYYALNLLCELDAPGEWYIDRTGKILYFYPPAPLTTGKTVLSMLENIFVLENCSHIGFSGLTMEHTRNTVVVIRGGAHCRISRCTIRNTSAWGAAVVNGRNHHIRHCDVYQLGEGGITLRGGDRKMLRPSKHSAAHNHIHHFGRLYRTYRPAVAVHGVGIEVTHNLIHDGPHNAIQLGGNNHLISYNEIHHVCHETGDVGAFYMGRDWTARGTVISYNYFHHIQGPGLHGAMAVYLDDAASGIRITGNIFYKAGRAAFIGGGRDNLVENNIFVDCSASVHVDARGVGWMRYHVENNGTLPRRLKAMPYKKPPWSVQYPGLVTILDDDPGQPKGNVVRRNISFGGTWLDVGKKAMPLITFEDNLVDRDPHFVDLEKQDFRLKPDSPAFTMGFKKIPIEKIGPETKHRPPSLKQP